MVASIGPAGETVKASTASSPSQALYPQRWPTVSVRGYARSLPISFGHSDKSDQKKPEPENPSIRTSNQSCPTASCASGTNRISSLFIRSVERVEPACARGAWQNGGSQVLSYAAARTDTGWVAEIYEPNDEGIARSNLKNGRMPLRRLKAVSSFRQSGCPLRHLSARSRRQSHSK